MKTAEEAKQATVDSNKRLDEEQLTSLRNAINEEIALGKNSVTYKYLRDNPRKELIALGYKITTFGYITW